MMCWLLFEIQMLSVINQTTEQYIILYLSSLYLRKITEFDQFDSVDQHDKAGVLAMRWKNILLSSMMLLNRNQNAKQIYFLNLFIHRNSNYYVKNDSHLLLYMKLHTNPHKIIWLFEYRMFLS